MSGPVACVNLVLRWYHSCDKQGSCTACKLAQLCPIATAEHTDWQQVSTVAQVLPTKSGN